MQPMALKPILKPKKTEENGNNSHRGTEAFIGFITVCMLTELNGPPNATFVTNGM